MTRQESDACKAEREQAVRTYRAIQELADHAKSAGFSRMKLEINGDAVSLYGYVGDETVSADEHHYSLREMTRELTRGGR